MGVFDSPTSKARTSAWRFTGVNSSYEYCATYPASLVVPSKISDTTLNYGKTYRSKARIPGLVYLHWANLGTITRSSQPMVGLKNNRSIQDEKLIEAIFTSHSQHHSTSNPEMANVSYIAHSHAVYGATPTNLIIDARPTTNAMANVAKGAGTENMDYYRNCKKVYLGIDNIHVMRDSLSKVAEAVRHTDKPPNYELLRKSNWLKHISAILEGILIIVKAVHLANSHVLVHCSDGWDRTSQLSSLSQICLDPYYRTKEGLAVLVEKDWVSFGHRFGDRCGHLVPGRVQFLNTYSESDDPAEDDVGFLASFQQRLNFSSSSHIRETCPVFDQFLDVIHQLQTQFPDAFEFNDLFLLDIQKMVYDCSNGTFLYNSERERVMSQASERTCSVWQVLLDPSRRSRYHNLSYDKRQQDVLFPEPKKSEWWLSWLKRPDLNVHEHEMSVQPEVPVPTVVENTSQDPVLSKLPIQQKPGADSASALGGRDSRDSRDVPDPLVQQSGPLPPSNNIRPFPGVFDNQAVSTASTAVQGAVRSAWSAWKSVRTGYESAARELHDADRLNGKGGGEGALAAQNDMGSAVMFPTEDNVWSTGGKNDPSGNKAPPWPATQAVPDLSKTPQAVSAAALDHQEDLAGLLARGSSATAAGNVAGQGNAKTATTPPQQHADPLGVNVWS